MKWLGRCSPKLDRVPCPVLIKQFINSEATFFIPASQLIIAENKSTEDSLEKAVGHDG
jgi:hypothetical protein